MKYQDLKETFFVVEASYYEARYLWREWHERIPMRQQDDVGFAEVIGSVNNMPVCVSVTRYNIWGKWVVFVEPVSAMVDHNMVREWIKKEILVHAPKWDNGTREPWCDVSSFHLCVDALKEATGKREI